MQSELAFFTEVEGAIARSSGARRADMARSLTDLFLANANRFSNDEIALIDDVFVRLVVTIEESSRTLLSAQMAPLSKGPPRLLHALACDNAINVASPILTDCEALDEETLIECAETKSQDHLLAISHRKSSQPRCHGYPRRPRRRTRRAEYGAKCRRDIFRAWICGFGGSLERR